MEDVEEVDKRKEIHALRVSVEVVEQMGFAIRRHCSIDVSL